LAQQGLRGFAVRDVMRFERPAAAPKGFLEVVAQAIKSPAPQTSLRLATFDTAASGLGSAAAITKLMATGLFEYVEIDHSQQKRRAPNDPLYGQQWHLNNQLRVGSDIGAVRGWDTFTGSGDEVVAVVDDGVQHTHPDLSANIWVNPREVAGNGIDDDGNGIIDDVYGADLVQKTGDVLPYDRNDSDHGTNVAGALAAVGNNALGISGVMWRAKIMVLKIEGPAPDYSLRTSEFVTAIRYAIAQKQAGVRIRTVNISYGSANVSRAYRDALLEADAAGIVVVVAAGNDGTQTALDVGYPTGYGLPNVISVGAFDRNGARAGFSNFGNQVHLFAPGQGILTTTSRTAFSNANGPYTPVDGTSFAAPLVAGMVGLIFDRAASTGAAAPSPRELRRLVMRNVNNISPQYDSQALGTASLGRAFNPTDASTAGSVPCAPTPPVLTSDRLLWSTAHTGQVMRVGAYSSCDGPPVRYRQGSLDIALRDDGVFPDEFAGDGISTATVDAPTNLATASYELLGPGGSRSLNMSLLTRFYGAEPVIGNDPAETSGGPVAITNWRDADGLNADDGVRTVAAPFALDFGGPTANSLVVSTNGYVCIVPNDDYANACASTQMRSLPFPNRRAAPYDMAVLAPWVDDWDLTSGGGSVTTDTVGTAPNRRFLITWRGVHHFSQAVRTASSGVSFQLALFERGGFEFRYTDTRISGGMVGGAPDPSDGATGNAGYQLAGGRQGAESFYRRASSTLQNSAWRYSSDQRSASDLSDVNVARAARALMGARISYGCGNGAFCGTSAVSKAQLAALTARAVLGHESQHNFCAYPSSGLADANASRYAPYINAMLATNILSPASAGSFGPDLGVSREAFAVAVVKALKGPSFVPAAARGRFADVGVGSANAAWIEAFAEFGLATETGLVCASGFCPNAVVTRAELARVFERAFRPEDRGNLLPPPGLIGVRP
jgi:subtilisin family serine protease